MSGAFYEQKISTLLDQKGSLLEDKLADSDEVEIVPQAGRDSLPTHQPQRVKKLTVSQQQYLKEKFIKPKLPASHYALYPHNMAQVMNGAVIGHEPDHLSPELKQLWRLYHGKKIENDEGILEGVDPYILQAAALKVFYEVFEPDLADEQIKASSDKIIMAPALSSVLFRGRFSLPEDLSGKILSYIAPVELYFTLYSVSPEIRRLAFFELRPYIKDDIQKNRHVFYTVGLPVRFTDRHYFSNTFSHRAVIPSHEFKLSDTNASGQKKAKIFRSRYAALKYAEQFRHGGDDWTEDINGFQPAVFKVIYRKECSDFDKNKKEVLFTINQGTRTNVLPWGEQSALVEFIEVPKNEIIPVEASLPLLENYRFEYRVHRVHFTTPFDLDTGSDSNRDSLYLPLYAEQENQRNWYTFYLILAAILLTPLSLLVSVPLWLSAKKNEPIQKLEMPEEAYKKIKLIEESLNKNLVETIEDKKNLHSGKVSGDQKREDEGIPAVKKSSIPGEFIFPSENNQMTLYCDKYRKERLMFFKHCCDEGVTELNETQKQFLEESEKKSMTMLMKSLMSKGV